MEEEHIFSKISAMDPFQIQLLFKRYLDKTITEPELYTLTRLLVEDRERENVQAALERLLSEEAPAEAYRPEEWNSLYEKIVGKPDVVLLTKKAKVVRVQWLKWAAAAVLLLIAGSVWYVANKTPVQQMSGSIRAVATDVSPAKEGAILVLANGARIVLDSLGNGVQTNEDGSQVVLQSGQLAYRDLSQNKAMPLTYHTILTPRGRQFRVKLPDGSEAWLNAASSITYPTRFTGGERRVEITGEVYFEVTKNAQMPFKVNAHGQAEIEVLGTHFNVNTYANEAAVKATLVEGSVRIKATQAKNSWVVIKPGQQAQVRQAVNVVPDVNVEQVLAWKNGLFDFEDASLKEVMWQLSRWYDIDVVFEKGVPDVAFGGKMNRNVPLSDVLKGLEAMNVHFRLEAGRKLVVLR